MMSAYTRGQQYCISWSIIKQLICMYLHKNRIAYSNQLTYGNGNSFPMYLLFNFLEVESQIYA
jgi:hypothetical protein